eukprot:350235-Chlamydomonas_euryale.AAC.4
MPGWARLWRVERGRQEEGELRGKEGVEEGCRALGKGGRQGGLVKGGQMASNGRHELGVARQARVQRDDEEHGYGGYKGGQDRDRVRSHSFTLFCGNAFDKA